LNLNAPKEEKILQRILGKHESRPPEGERLIEREAEDPGKGKSGGKGEKKTLQVREIQRTFSFLECPPQGAIKRLGKRGEMDGGTTVKIIRVPPQKKKNSR